ncbi:MAG: amidohydrolase family protein [Candidatus Obscuribacterales bacterium]|nr:amidohydrolase family protein [Candidatus Obscuribacterales bacterium]
MTDLHSATEFLLARWILPVSGPAQENACLAIAGEKILGVISRKEYEALPANSKQGKSRDLGEAIILPGLINLHTHLDYSALKHFDNYSHFFSWIRNLIAQSWQWDSKQWLLSANGGAREIIMSGTSLIADSSYSGAAAKAVARNGLRGIVGLELFGIEEEDASRVFDEWLKKYEQFISDPDPSLQQALKSSRLRVTIAPHTPYSVCPALISKALQWAKEKELPMFIHISESEAECRWIASHDNDLDNFLKEAFRGDPPPLPWKGHGLSPVKHLEKHNLLSSNVLAAHLVQINDADIQALASHDVSAVHCPRSNSRLRNGVAPLSKMAAAGLRIGFGTDSGASTDDLNVLSEARFAWDLQRAVDKEFSESAEKAVYYLTLGAATALQMQASVGSLESGKKSDFAVFSIKHLPEIARQRPHECLIYGGAKLEDLVVNGVKLLGHGYIL